MICIWLNVYLISIKFSAFHWPLDSVHSVYSVQRTWPMANWNAIIIWQMERDRQFSRQNSDKDGETISVFWVKHSIEWTNAKQLMDDRFCEKIMRRKTIYFTANRIINRFKHIYHNLHNVCAVIHWILFVYDQSWDNCWRHWCDWNFDCSFNNKIILLNFI